MAEHGLLIVNVCENKYCVTIFLLTGVYKLFMFFNISNENFPESLSSFSTNGFGFGYFIFIVVFQAAVEL